MNKQLYFLNTSLNNINFCKSISKERVNNPSDIYRESLSGKKVLLAQVTDKSQLQYLINDRFFQTACLPVIFVFEFECEDSIQACLAKGFTNIFMRSNQMLLKNYITYLFENYDNEVNLNTERLFDCLRESDLTKKEFDILKIIVQAPQQTLRKDDLQAQVWGGHSLRNGTNTLDVHICNMRKKLKAMPLTIISESNGLIALRPQSHFHKEICF